jgi:hypothetical protein
MKKNDPITSNLCALLRFFRKEELRMKKNCLSLEKQIAERKQSQLQKEKV